MAHQKREAYAFVTTLTNLLLNKDAFAVACKNVEAVFDANAPSTRLSIVFQADDVLKIVCEGLQYVDMAFLAKISAAIPGDKYQIIEVIKPCASVHVTEVYDPISVMVQISTDIVPPAPTQPDDADLDAFPKLQVNNIRDINIPEGLRVPVLRILNALYNGYRKNAPCPIKNVSFAAGRTALIIKDPPSYSLDFLSSLVADFPGIVTDYRFEFVVEDAKTYFTIYMHQISGGSGGGYTRAKRTRSLWSKLNPF